MVKTCSAWGCTQRQLSYSDILFHRFPLNHPELLQKWIAATRRENFTPSSGSALCSLHFKPKDYRLIRDKKRLKKTAVPSIFYFPENLPEPLPKRLFNTKKKLLPPSECPLVEEEEEDEEEEETKDMPLSVDAQRQIIRSDHSYDSDLKKQLKAALASKLFLMKRLKRFNQIERTQRRKENRMKRKKEKDDRIVEHHSHTPNTAVPPAQRTGHNFNRLTKSCRPKQATKMSKAAAGDVFLKLLRKLNCVNIQETVERGCLPFFVSGQQVGLIRPDFWVHLKNYPHIFTQLDNGVHLCDSLRDYQQRTAGVMSVLEDLRAKDVLPFLRGWRDENYSVRTNLTEEPLLEVERAASGVFGFVQYGVHINGYTWSQDGEMKMWIGKRSPTKPTFPNMFDNMSAGGLPAGMGVVECARKECQEEASVPDDVLYRLKAVGCISYFYEDSRGLQPEHQFIYDLELPSDFVPTGADGEMSGFQQIGIDQVKNEIVGENFKPNCAAICLDFLIRHGCMNFDSNPNIPLYIEQMHVPLQSIYSQSL